MEKMPDHKNTESDLEDSAIEQLAQALVLVAREIYERKSYNENKSNTQ